MEKTAEEILIDAYLEEVKDIPVSGLSLFSANDCRILMSRVAEFSSQDKWISVEERLPEKGNSGFPDLVITIDQHTNIRLLRYDYEFRAWNTKFYAGEKVSHWMPLPSPPKTK